MWKAIAESAAGLLKLVNKLVPSYEWKGGKASSEAEHAKETLNAKERADDVPERGDRATRKRLRKGKF